MEHDWNRDANEYQGESPDELCVLNKACCASEDVKVVACVQLLIQLVHAANHDFKHAHK